jgi:hypothetical protein
LLKGRETLLPMSLEDVFGRMPTDTQVVSHILHGHVATQFDHVAFKSPRMSAIRIGERDLDLPNHSSNLPPDRIMAIKRALKGDFDHVAFSGLEGAGTEQGPQLGALYIALL